MFSSVSWVTILTLEGACKSRLVTNKGERSELLVCRHLLLCGPATGVFNLIVKFWCARRRQMQTFGNPWNYAIERRKQAEYRTTIELLTPASKNPFIGMMLSTARPGRTDLRSAIIFINDWHLFLRWTWRKPSPDSQSAMTRDKGQQASLSLTAHQQVLHTGSERGND